MAVEVDVGILVSSLALLSDAAHMLSDAVALALSLVAIRLAKRPSGGSYTFGWQRAGILSAQFNGATLLVLGLLIVFEGIRRIIDPPGVEGGVVLVVALLGIVVNLIAIRVLSQANRQSLNVEGSYQHILTDLLAFVFTAIAGLVIVLTGFDQADGIASLVIAAIMIQAAYGLLRESGRVFLEAAPRGLDPDEIGGVMAAHPGRLRGPRPAPLGGHLRLPRFLRARHRRRGRRLPRDPPRARARAPRALRARPHDAPGGPPPHRGAAPGRGSGIGDTSTHDRTARRADRGPLRRARARHVGPRRDRRPRALRGGRAASTTSSGARTSWPREWRTPDRRPRRRPRAARGRGRRGAAPDGRRGARRGSRSSPRGSASRWSSATPTTTRT